MGVDLSAVFNKLNTNTQGDSANILDNDEVKSAKKNGCIFTVEEGMTSETFIKANQRDSGKVSVFDTDANQNVSVEEQQATILDKLKNVWTSAVARFFKDDIDYNDSNAQAVDNQVKARQQNAIDYLEYAKENNVDSVFIEENDEHDYTDQQGNTYISGNNNKATVAYLNSDGTHTTTYEDGSTRTWRNDNSLMLSVEDSSRSYKYNYNEDGSYTWIQKNKGNNEWHTRNDKYDKQVGEYQITKRGSIKVVPQDGTTFDAALDQLGITDEGIRQAIKKANPKANKAGKFENGNDLYIPANLVQQLNLDENKLLDLGVVS